MKTQIERLCALDPEIGAVVADELKRQRDGLELIASENVVSELSGAETILSFVPEPTYAPCVVCCGVCCGAAVCVPVCVDVACSGVGCSACSGSGCLLRFVMESVTPSSVRSSRTPTFRIR